MANLSVLCLGAKPEAAKNRVVSWLATHFKRHALRATLKTMRLNTCRDPPKKVLKTPPNRTMCLRLYARTVQWLSEAASTAIMS